MAGEIRWATFPATYLRGPTLPGEGHVVFVPVVDILPQLDRPDDLRDTLELLLTHQAELGRQTGRVQHARARKLWHCSRGHWSCVVIAKSETGARANAERIWDSVEGYESDHDWLIQEGDGDAGAVVIGWS